MAAQRASIPMVAWVERTLDEKARSELSHSASVPAKEDQFVLALESALKPVLNRLERLERPQENVVRKEEKKSKGKEKKAKGKKKKNWRKAA